MRSLRVWRVKRLVCRVGFASWSSQYGDLCSTTCCVEELIREHRRLVISISLITTVRNCANLAAAVLQRLLCTPGIRCTSLWFISQNFTCFRVQNVQDQSNAGNAITWHNSQIPITDVGKHCRGYYRVIGLKLTWNRLVCFSGLRTRSVLSFPSVRWRYNARM